MSFSPSTSSQQNGTPHKATYRPRSRRDVLSSVWILISLATSAAFLAGHATFAQPLWTSIHVVTLGVATTGIIHWTWYFARALLHLGADDPRATRDNVIRLAVSQVAFVTLVTGMWLPSIGVVIGAVGMYVALILWHGISLWRCIRQALKSRFAAVLHYYEASAAFFLLAIILAVLSAVGLLLSPSDLHSYMGESTTHWLLEGRDALTFAHFLAGVGGWILLTIAGTIVTFYPTLLRTRMAPSAVEDSLTVLPLWCASLLMAITSACAASFLGEGQWTSTGEWIALRLTAVAVWGVVIAVIAGIARPLLVAAHRKIGNEFPALCASGALFWLLAMTIAFAVYVTLAPSFSALRDGTIQGLPLVAMAGLLPLFTATLSFLTPVATGGGPAALKAAVGVINRYATLRVLVRNMAAALVVITYINEAYGMSDSLLETSALRMTLWLIIGGVTVWDLVMIATSVVVSHRHRTQVGNGHFVATPSNATQLLGSTAFSRPTPEQPLSPSQTEATPS